MGMRRPVPTPSRGRTDSLSGGNVSAGPPLGGGGGGGGGSWARAIWEPASSHAATNHAVAGRRLHRVGPSLILVMTFIFIRPPVVGQVSGCSGHEWEGRLAGVGVKAAASSVAGRCYQLVEQHERAPHAARQRVRGERCA